jgi:hypothetical protein
MTIIFFGYFLGVLMVLVLLPESPSFLLKKERNSDLRRAVRHMGEFNYIDNSNMQKALNDLEQIIECWLFYKFKSSNHHPTFMKNKNNFQTKNPKKLKSKTQKASYLHFHTFQKKRTSCIY